jgi:N-hydroxyarylamine O-acetyltransferase
VLWVRQDSEGLHSDHMIITVDIGGLSFLADVGFGGLMLTAPLRLTPDMPQATPHGSYRITGEDPHLRLEAVRDGEWWPAYEFSLEPVDDAAYDQLNRDLNADPDWFLKHNLLVERVTPTARHVLFDTHVTTTTGEDRTHHSLANVGELRESLNTTFNITLPDADGLDTTLARLVARAPAGV